MKRGVQIFEGIFAIVCPIIFAMISGVTDVLVSEMIIIPFAICFFTGKGVIE